MEKIVNTNSKKTVSVWTYVILPGIIILFAIIALNWFTCLLEISFFENVFKSQFDVSTTLITRKFQNSLAAAEDLGAFFEGSEDITKKEFDAFASTAIKVRKPLGISLTLEWIDQDNLIQYVYPNDEDNDKIVVTDYNRYPDRLAPLLKAIETKSPVTSEPTILGRGYSAILIYFPVYKEDKYLGSTVSVVRLSELFTSAIDASHTYEKNGYLKTNKYIIPLDGSLIYTFNGEQVINFQGETIKNSESDQYISPSRTEAIEDIVFADKNWEIRITPNYFFEVTKIMWFFTSISFTFGILIIILLYIIYNRQKKLIEEKSLIGALLSGIGEGVVACDKNDKIIFSNDITSKLIGYTQKEIIGKSYFDIFKITDEKGNYISKEMRIFTKAISTGNMIPVSLNNHYFLIKKDETRFAFTAMTSPIWINGVVDGAIVVFRDATKENEIDKMKTEFLSLAAHQLLTPVSAINWLSELLLSDKKKMKGAKKKELLTNIQISARTMSGLINSLLNISRIESGRIIVEPEPTSLKDLVNRLLEELKNKIEEKKQKVTLSVDSKLKKINVDPRLIGEVYKNYLTNAIKYTPENGKILIEIKIKNKEVISKVIDNGYGIPKNEQAKIFSKFFRGTNIVKIEKDGNGLGLYLVKQIVDVSGGKVGLESELNKGSTFWFTLPLAGSKPKAGEVKTI